MRLRALSERFHSQNKWINQKTVLSLLQMEIRSELGCPRLHATYLTVIFPWILSASSTALLHFHPSDPAPEPFGSIPLPFSSFRPSYTLPQGCPKHFPIVEIAQR